MIYILLFIIALMSASLIIVIIFALKDKSRGNPAELENKLLQMKGEISESMKGSRDDLERTKDMISANTIESMKMIRDLNETISKLTMEQKTATEISKDLKYFFDRPKLRGNYGEYILEELVSKIVPKEMYATQYQFDDNTKVDLVLFYREMVIPIDSKFPTELFSRYMEEKDEKLKAEHYRRFSEEIKKIAASISSKYIKPGSLTSDFAIMFVPSDAIYFECLSATQNPQRDSLFDSLMKSRVVLASPSTLFAFLSVVMTGMKQYRFYKHSKQIREESEKLKKHVENFMKQYESAGEAIQKAESAYETSRKHLESVRSAADRITRVQGADAENEKKEE